MNESIPLNEDNFAKQMFRSGYLYEQIPNCFTSDSFASNCEKVFAIPGTKHPVTSPLIISMYKNENERREISIPNPFSFASAVKCFKSNWTKCRQFANSNNSHSPITVLHTYAPFFDIEKECEYINSPSQRLLIGKNSGFVENLKERLIASLGLPYKLTLDLANFYDSIYTHSLSWVLCGKEEAKRWHAIKENKEEKQHPDLEPKYYFLADQFDNAIRRQKGNETNGIVTGPFTSRIFSEMLLAGIDAEIRRTIGNGENPVFRRYVDDYSFYFHSEEEAKDAVRKLEKLFRQYGLKINTTKTKIERYPFDLNHELNRAFKEAISERGVFGVLNEAGILFSGGQKGAYLYALKFLRSQDKRYSTSDDRDHAAELSLLINIGLTQPNCASLALNYIHRNQNRYDIKQMGEALNRLISVALDGDQDQEAINGFHFGIQLGMRFKGSNIEKAIKRGNDLCRIMALDVYRHGEVRIDFESHDKEIINDAIGELETSLKDANCDGPHWLLLYESLNHGLLDVDLGTGKTTEAMKKLAELGVSFYRGIGKPQFEWTADQKCLA